jgi:trimethylamine--corrinoid protein Co-methyltransferase
MYKSHKPQTEFIDDIIRDAYDVLTKKGIEIESPLVSDILRGAGCNIISEIRKNHKVTSAKIPAELVDKSLASAPKTINLHNTRGELTISFDKNIHAFSTGSCGRIFWDARSGNHRSTSADLAKFIRVSDCLEQIDIVSTAMVPHDVEPNIQDVYRLLAVLQNSQKPVITGIFPKAGESNFERMKDILLVFRNSEEELKEKPFAIFDCCPDPLKWSKTLSECLIQCGRYGIPTEIISMPQPGLSYPATLYESVVQSVTETLAGFVISQTANPGAPVIWGGSASSINFERGRTDAELASPAVMKMLAAYAAVARKFDLPTHTYAIADSSTIDVQYGIDKQRAVSRAMQAGINNITGLGMYGEEDILSCESLVIDNDIVGAEVHTERGMEKKRTNPLEDISFLADEGVLNPETAAFLRSDEYFRSRTFDRDRRKPMLERAIQVVDEILAKRQPEYLSDEQTRSLKSCLS